MALAFLMILAAGIFRLVAHDLQWWNVAPLAAMALLGGMYFGRRYALWVPLAVLAVTDLALNAQMHYPLVYWPRLIDYAAFLAIGLLGLWSRRESTGTKVGCAVLTPFLFFLVSNFGVWMFGMSLANHAYPATIAGLTECYAAGLPFLRGTLIGDWAFMTLFVAIAVMARRAVSPRWHQLVAEARA
jgi:hypothetical protein